MRVFGKITIIFCGGWRDFQKKLRVTSVVKGERQPRAQGFFYCKWHICGRGSRRCFNYTPVKGV